MSSINAYVVDASAFMDVPSGENYTLKGSMIYMPQTIYNELKSTISKSRLDTSAFASIQILNPSKKFIIEVKRFLQQVGQGGLSDNDVALIALAQELTELKVPNLVVLSDDFAIRNVCMHLKIPVKGVNKLKKKFKKRSFTNICKACNQKYRYSIRECEVCGHTSFYRKVAR